MYENYKIQRLSNISKLDTKVPVWRGVNVFYRIIDTVTEIHTLMISYQLCVQSVSNAIHCLPGMLHCNKYIGTLTKSNRAALKIY